MKRAPRKSPDKTALQHLGKAKPPQVAFDEVLKLIDAARGRTLAAVNTALIEHYWQIGEYISQKIATEQWGQGTVEELAEHIRRHQPNARGYSAQNLWRMRQFHETYRDLPKLSALLRELTWTHNLLVMGKPRTQSRIQNRECKI